MRRSPPLATTLLALATVVAGSPLFAACGGGGSTGPGYGYGSPPIDPTYTPTSTAFPTSSDPGTSGTTASTDAVARGKVLVVLQQHRAPIGIWDEKLAAQSKKDLPFVKYEDAAATQFAQRWGIQSIPAVALCDKLGNVLAVTSFPVTARNVHFIIDHANDEAAQLSKNLDVLYQAAERADDGKRYAVAFTDLSQLQRYQGFEVCTKGSALQSTLLQKGRDAIAQAEGGASHSESRTQLSTLISSYRGTVVADEARVAMRQLE